MFDFFTDFLLNSTFLNKYVFSYPDIPLFLSIILAVILFVLLVYSLKFFEKKQYFLFGFSITIFTFLILFGYSFISLKSNIKELYGSQNKFYYGVEQKIYEGESIDKEKHIFLSSKGFIIKTIDKTPFFYSIGKINCESSLADCNAFLTKNFQTIKSFLKKGSSNE